MLKDNVTNKLGYDLDPDCYWIRMNEFSFAVKKSWFEDKSVPAQLVEKLQVGLQDNDKVDNIYTVFERFQVYEYFHNTIGPAAYNENDPAVCEYWLDGCKYTEQDEWKKGAAERKFDGDFLASLKEEV